jgi:uncharacterized protein (DUF885 family)
MRKNIITIVFISLVLFSPFFTSGADKTKPSPAHTGENKDIEQLFDSYCRQLVKRFPESASYIGFNKKMGYEVETGQLNDESVETGKKLFVLMRKYRQQLDTYDRKQLTPSQRRAADILRYALDRDLEAEKFQHHFYIIGHISDFHNVLTTLMTEYHTISNIDDAKAYISRLGKYKEKFNQISNRLKIKAKNDLLAPAHIIENFSYNLSNFIRMSPQNNILYRSFRNQVQELDIDKELKDRLCLEAGEKIKSVVYPCYQALIGLLKRLKQKAPEETGVWRLPSGDSFYRYCLRYHTGTSMTPEQIHKLGIKEVNRIQREIKRRLTRAGFEANLPSRDLLRYFWSWEAKKNRDQLYYPNTNQGKARALQDYQNYLEKITAKLPGLFSRSPKTKLLVKPVPRYKRNTTGAHYQPAPLDGKRSGIFYMNLTYPPFKPGMKTLAVHEGIPGHHFQVSIERESPHIRMFRHFLFFTAYIEGWALYAEKLAMENGWFEDLYSQLGYLNSELFRAVRLVLDTGIHYKRWSRDRAITYMRDNLGWVSPGEIDRYIAWPGQACAYKIGELKILELRKHAKKMLKKRFDIKKFHSVILENGAVPLPLLESYVNEYIMKPHGKRKREGAG